jgi:hypothetical protein
MIFACYKKCCCFLCSLHTSAVRFSKMHYFQFLRMSFLYSVFLYMICIFILYLYTCSCSVNVFGNDGRTPDHSSEAKHATYSPLDRRAAAAMRVALGSNLQSAPSSRLRAISPTRQVTPFAPHAVRIHGAVTVCVRVRIDTPELHLDTPNVTSPSRHRYVYREPLGPLSNNLELTAKSITS